MTYKVAIISPTHNIYGGGQVYIESLYSGLSEYGVDVSIYSSDNVFIKSRKIKKLSSWLDKLKNLRSAIVRLKKDSIDIVILNDTNISMLSFIFSLFGFKTYSLIHMDFSYSPRVPVLFSNVIAFIRGGLISLGSKKVFNINKKNSLYIYWGKELFLGNLLPLSFYNIKVRKYKDKDFDMAYIGRLSSEKNIEGLLSFISFACKHDNSLKFLIVGQGQLSDFCFDYIKNYNLDSNVTIMGFKKHSELLSIYKRVKVNLLFSHTEGFPTTILESAAFCVPTLVPKVGSCDFLSQKYSSIITTFDHGDSYEIIFDKFLEILKHDSQESVYEEFLSDFTISKISSKVLNEIKL